MVLGTTTGAAIGAVVETTTGAATGNSSAEVGPVPLAEIEISAQLLAPLHKYCPFLARVVSVVALN